MRESVFTETLQVAIVARDLEATMRMCVHDYGIGPWDIYEFNPRDVKDLEMSLERRARYGVDEPGWDSPRSAQVPVAGV